MGQTERTSYLTQGGSALCANEHMKLVSSDSESEPEPDLSDLLSPESESEVSSCLAWIKKNKHS